MLSAQPEPLHEAASGPSAEEREPTEEPVAPRLHRALGPLAVGVLLDLLDLSTFGPLGVYVGVPVGLAAGWYLGAMAGLGVRARLIFGTLAAVYLSIPMTEFLPVGTGVGALSRFRSSSGS